MHRNRTLPLLMISYGNRCFEFKDTFLDLRAPKDESSGEARPSGAIELRLCPIGQTSILVPYVDVGEG